MPELIRLPRGGARRQRGAGALIVVLVLFFVMALVAAYSSRNMIFEQRTSANQYRSTQAFEVAEAGIEWGLAMLNGGRIDAACQPVANTTDTSFRDRYLMIDPTTGAILRRSGVSPAPGLPPSPSLHASCYRTANGWSCICPGAADNPEPVLTAPSTDDPQPAFRLSFSNSVTPGVMTLQAKGCTRVTPACLNDTLDSGNTGDATAVIEVTVALKGALSTPPAAALTAGRNVDATGALTVVNTDVPTNGVTVHAGGPDPLAAAVVLQSFAGTPGANSIVLNDSALFNRSADTQLIFASYFGMRSDTYAQQPAAITLTCPAQCSATNLRDTAAYNPGRMLWLNGTVDLGTSVDIGSATVPVVMVVSNGDLRSSATAARIFGVVYVDKDQWITQGGGLQIQGAAIARGDITGTGTPTVVFDADIVRRLRVATGSFVRVPGGWKDF